MILILLAMGLCVLLLIGRVGKGASMSVLVSVGLAAVGLYVGLGIMLFVLQPRMVFVPWKGLEVSPKVLGAEVEAVEIRTFDGLRLCGWYVPAEGAGQTVLFCHGNAGNIGHRIESLEFFRSLGLNCLIFDYRGYGDSEGRPTEAGVYMDARAAWDWLIENKKILPSDIIIFGRSIGGSVAAQLAGELHREPRVRPGGLVLESTFSRFVDLGYHYYPFMPVRLFARFEFDTLRAMESVECPVLVIHSPDDEIIPFKLGQKVFDAARPPKQFGRIRGGHNEGFLEDGQTYRQIWLDWLEDTFRTP